MGRAEGSGLATYPANRQPVPGSDRGAGAPRRSPIKNVSRSSRPAELPAAIGGPGPRSLDPRTAWEARCGAGGFHSTSAVRERSPDPGLSQAPALEAARDPFLLEDAYRRLARHEQRLLRSEAAALADLHRRSAHLALGFASFADLARERLQTSPRTVQERLLLHDLLGRFPLLERAFLHAELSLTQCLLLRPVLETETQACWVALARGTSVSALRTLVRDQSGSDVEAPGEEPGRLVSFALPPAAAMAWDLAMETASRVLGSLAPRYRCVEAILAEAAVAPEDGEDKAARAQDDRGFEDAMAGAASSGDAQAAAMDTKNVGACGTVGRDLREADEEVGAKNVSPAIRSAAVRQEPPPSSTGALASTACRHEPPDPQVLPFGLALRRPEPPAPEAPGLTPRHEPADRRRPEPFAPGGAAAVESTGGDAFPLVLPRQEPADPRARCERGLRPPEPLGPAARGHAPPSPRPLLSETTGRNLHGTDPRLARILGDVEALLASIDTRLPIDSPQDVRAQGDPARRDPDTILARLAALRRARRPLRMLRARVLREIRRPGSLPLLGHRRFADYAQTALGLSDRAARDLLREADLWDAEPFLASEYCSGRLALTHVRLLRSLAARPLQPAFAGRARELTVRQFLKESRFLFKLRDRFSQIARDHPGPFPICGLEDRLVRELATRGCSQVAMTRELTDRGLAIDPGASTDDPAENPVVLLRLEALLDRLTLLACLELADADSDRPSAPPTEGKPKSDGDADPPTATAGDRDPLGDPAVGRANRQTSAPRDPAGNDEPGSNAATPTLDRQTSAPARTGAPVNDPAPADGRAHRPPSTRLAPLVRIRFWAPNPIADAWDAAIQRLRAGPDPLPVWAAVTLLLSRALAEWHRHDPATRPTEWRILERDGYLCQAPGCSFRRSMEAHHVLFRSHQGGDQGWNKVVLCAVHHRHVIHEARWRLTGRAPQRLVWTLRRRDPDRPRDILRTLRGDRVVFEASRKP